MFDAQEGIDTLGSVAGSAIGSNTYGGYLEKKWGNNSYYRAKARSLNQQKAVYDAYERALAAQDSSLQQNPRTAKKYQQQLIYKRDAELAALLQNEERQAEVARRNGGILGRATGSVGGALGGGALGYLTGEVGQSLYTKGDNMRHFANFSQPSPEEMAAIERQRRYTEGRRAANQVSQGFVGGAGAVGLAAAGASGYNSPEGQNLKARLLLSLAEKQRQAQALYEQGQGMSQDFIGNSRDTLNEIGNAARNYAGQGALIPESLRGFPQGADSNYFALG